MAVDPDAVVQLTAERDEARLWARAYRELARHGRWLEEWGLGPHEDIGAVARPAWLLDPPPSGS